MNITSSPSEFAPTDVVEDVLSEADFNELAALVQGMTGISLPPSKKTLVQARLAKRLRILRMHSFSAYCKLVSGTDAAALDERPNLISAITTNVTRFYREPHHFEDLKTRVLPPLIERARAGGRVRIWSAGCSTGQEPYCIAMTILEMMPDALRHDIKILATDLDHIVLSTAEKGKYGINLMEGVTDAQKNSFFEVSGNGEDRMYTVRPEPRKLISFKQLNLTGPWPMKGRFDFIFCRNVVIYFEHELEINIFEGFAEKLMPGGYLFVGHSERINTLEVPLFETAGVTTYRKV